jgi:hypothetical protein
MPRAVEGSYALPPNAAARHHIRVTIPACHHSVVFHDGVGSLKMLPVANQPQARLGVNYAPCAHICADRYRDRRNLLLSN